MELVRVQYIRICTDRLKQLNPGLASEVRQVLDVNKQERHIRGSLQPEKIPASALNVLNKTQIYKKAPADRRVLFIKRIT